VIDQGVVDIIQVDINHVGGISALWKVAALAEVAGITMAPHSCEGPIPTGRQDRRQPAAGSLRPPDRLPGTRR